MAEISNEVMKKTVVRHVCAAFDDLPVLPKQTIKFCRRSILQKLETEFSCDLSSKKNFIMETIASIITNGVYDFKKKRFSYKEDNCENNGKAPSNIQENDDEPLYAFGKEHVGLNTHISHSVPAISYKKLKIAVEKHVHVAIKAKRLITENSIRYLLETEFSCDLKDRKQFILLAIHETLNNLKSILSTFIKANR